MIPAEAVEAAAKAIYEDVNKAHADMKGWGEVAPQWKASYRSNARAALEVATPIIAAQAWNEGCETGSKFNEGYEDHALTLNPYQAGQK